MVQQLARLSDSKQVKGSVSRLGASVCVISLLFLCEFTSGNLASLQFKTTHIRLLKTLHSLVISWVQVIVLLFCTISDC